MENKNRKPTVFDPLPTQKHRVRYVANQSYNSIAYTSYDLHNAVGLVATTSILGNNIAQMARLKRVEVWSPVFSSAASASCAIRTITAPSTGGNNDSGFNERRKTLYDVSTDVSHPAHLVYTPLQGTLAAAWHNPNTLANSSQLFVIDVTLGSYIDIWVEYVLNRDTSASVTSVTQALVGATAGQIYLRALGNAGSITPDPQIYAII